MSLHPLSVMIFAAGLGTRMGPLTRDCPKPLLKVQGRAMLDHALDLARALRPRRIVVNTHYLAPMIVAHLHGTDILINHEDTLLDTGGGLRAALPLLGPGPVFTLNPDALWSGPNPLLGLRDAWRPGKMGGLLMMHDSPPARDFAMDDEGRLTRGPGLSYTGAQIVETEALAAIPEAVFSLNRLWDILAGQHRLFGVAHPGGWRDIGNEKALIEAEQ